MERSGVAFSISRCSRGIENGIFFPDVCRLHGREVAESSY